MEGTSETLRRLNRAYRALSECNRALVRSASEQQLLDDLCRILVEVGGYRLAWVGFRDDGPDRLVRPAAVAGDDTGYLASVRITWDTGEHGRGPTGNAVRTGVPAVNRDTDTNPDFLPWREAARARGFASSIAVPLQVDGGVVGALAVYASQPDAFDTEERDLLIQLAGDLSYGLGALRGRERQLAAEAALREREEHLRQSAKMEAVGQLASGIAHDFNNLLTVILGSVTALREQPGLDAAARTGLEDVAAAARLAAELTGQLLAFGRRSAVQPRVVALERLVERLRPILARALGAGVELEVRAGPGLRRVSIDPAAFQQVVLNLALNARDAMPEGGRLAIRLANAEPGAGGPDGPAGPLVLLEVSDTGLGMDPEVRQRVFEPFFTTKVLGRGTGLGLATVFGIVRQAGGQIAVESAPGRGSTFRVLLPATDAPAEPGGEG